MKVQTSNKIYVHICQAKKLKVEAKICKITTKLNVGTSASFKEYSCKQFWHANQSLHIFKPADF